MFGRGSWWHLADESRSICFCAAGIGANHGEDAPPLHATILTTTSPLRISRRSPFGGVARRLAAEPAACADLLPGNRRDVAPALTGRVVAVGITGAGAISPVGRFHPGSPFRDKPEFAAFTQPGKLLGSERPGNEQRELRRAAGAGRPTHWRCLVADPRGDTLLVVLASFATAGDQASGPTAESRSIPPRARPSTRSIIPTPSRPICSCQT
jgi:hypothetical protein